MNKTTYEELIDRKDIVRFRNDEELQTVMDFDPEHKPDVRVEEFPVPEGLLVIERHGLGLDGVVDFRFFERDGQVMLDLKVHSRIRKPSQGTRRLPGDVCEERAHVTLNVERGEIDVIHFDHELTNFIRLSRIARHQAEGKLSADLFDGPEEIKEMMAGMTIDKLSVQRAKTFKMLALLALSTNLYMLFGIRPGNRRIDKSVPTTSNRTKKWKHLRKVKMARAVYELGGIEEVGQGEAVEEARSKRTYNAKGEECRVRGHWRTYKNGRRVFIEPFVRNKGGERRTREFHV